MLKLSKIKDQNFQWPKLVDAHFQNAKTTRKVDLKKLETTNKAHANCKFSRFKNICWVYLKMLIGETVEWLVRFVLKKNFIFPSTIINFIVMPRCTNNSLLTNNLACKSEMFR